MTLVSAAAERMIKNGGLGIVMQAGEWTATNGTSITAVRHLQALDQYVFYGRPIWRPESASLPADELRYATTVTVDGTGVLTFIGTVADTTETGEELFLLEKNIQPQYIFDALNTALQKLYFPNLEPLSQKPLGTGVADAGHQASGTGSFTTSNTSHSKITTANSNNVRTGVGSSRIQNSAANGHIYQDFDVDPGQRVLVWACGRIDSGTSAELVLNDVTGSANIGTTLTHTGESFAYIKRQETVPASCEQLRMMLGGTGASDDVYWDAHHFYIEEVGYFPLDSTWMDDEFGGTGPKLKYLVFQGNQISSGVWHANASSLETVPQEDYSIRRSDQEAHPFVVQFHNGSQAKWYQYPLFIDGRRRHADIAGTLTNASWATDVKVDIDLWESRARMDLFNDARVRAAVPDWQDHLLVADRNFKQAAPRFVDNEIADRNPGFVFRGVR